MTWMSSILGFGGRQKEAGGPVGEARPLEAQSMLNVDVVPTKCKGTDDAPLFSTANVGEARRARSWFDDRVRRAKNGDHISEVVSLTPALAELLLERNPNNRSIRERKVDEYKADIAAGNWSLNGETIKISTDGLLNDGQHRCRAVIAAATPIKTAIVFGLPRDSRMTVDQGAVRTAGNYLGMDGVANGNVVAAVASLLWQHEVHGKITDGSSRRPTRAQVRETTHRHPGIVDSVNAVPNGRVAGSKSILVFCHYLIARHARHQANEFISRLCLGAGLPEDDPVYQCRERLLVRNKPLKPAEKINLILRTWNAVRRGRKMRKAVKVTGDLPEVEA